MGFGTQASAVAGAILTVTLASFSGPGNAGPLAMVDPTSPTATIFEQVLHDPEAKSELTEHLRRQVVTYPTREPSGTIVIDTPNTVLYLVLGGGKAIRYAIGVGREGFTWSGVQSVSRKAEWPDWIPPEEMIQRQKYLPRWMAGGPGNPLGARAIYLGSTEYRIHGTNDPTTIGKFVSSGCIRLTNEDVADLFSRVDVGTKVVVLPKNAPHLATRPLEAMETRTSITVRPARPAVTTLP